MQIMENWIYLSYILSPETPTYGNAEGIKISSLHSMGDGDTSNSSLWHIPNHTGTHIDFPKHFVSDGKTADDFPASFWWFENVKVITIKETRPGMIIGPEEFSEESIPENTELLLVRTGFFRYRGSDMYWKENPVFLPEIAETLRKICPGIRAFGFDSISLSSFTERPLGRVAHRAFLDDPHPILPLEDMDLSVIDEDIEIKVVVVLPVRISGADAAPCNVVALLE